MNTQTASTEPKAKRVTKKAQKELDKQRDIASLKSLIKPGDTIYTILKHVSTSGMYRRIALVIKTEDGLRNISGLAADVAGYKWCDDDSLGAHGCGMDMGFDIVYNLGRELFNGNFICTGETCYSNDHVNGDRNRTPHQHGDGGYALRREWL